MRAAVVCLLAVAGVVLAGVPGKERPHDAPAFQSVMTKTDSGCACKPWSRTIYNTSAAVSKLNNECADPEDDGSLWCFTEAPCATPTDTCTPPPQARNYEADGGASVVTFGFLLGLWRSGHLKCTRQPCSAPVDIYVPHAQSCVLGFRHITAALYPHTMMPCLSYPWCCFATFYCRSNSFLPCWM